MCRWTSHTRANSIHGKLLLHNPPQVCPYPCTTYDHISCRLQVGLYYCTEGDGDVEDDAQTQHEPEVIGVEDRADGLVLADLSDPATGDVPGCPGSDGASTLRCATRGFPDHCPAFVFDGVCIMLVRLWDRRSRLGRIISPGAAFGKSNMT